MPYVMDWPPKRILAVALVGLAMLIAAPVASADSSSGCPIPPSSPVFAPFGDNANYSLVPGGDFEGSMAGWTLNNASVANGNEPWQVGGQSDSQSLQISPGGEAVSPSFCVTNAFPNWRFFALSNANGGWHSGLRVSIQWTGQNGQSGEVPVAYLPSGWFTQWQPTRSLMLGALLQDGTTMQVQLVFDAGSGGSWNIDDVYIDPYAK
jgi:hypothetical protein